VCSTYNEVNKDNKKTAHKPPDEIHGLEILEDINNFIQYLEDYLIYTSIKGL
tara:strand:+ start:74 stop:229 length:156 start_codon:yes stop_codon:yes gene_type:complete